MFTLTPSPEERLVRSRTERDPRPHFKPNLAHQLDPLLGCPAIAVPANHMARAVEAAVASLDLSKLEAKYSSLGQNGFAPSSLLAVWIYASLKGLHHSTKVAEALKTDLAYRYLGWGYEISAGILRQFRRENGDFFEEAIQQTVAIAQQRNLLATDELAVDSVRLRAHASLKATRTLSRSKQRLLELAAADLTQLTQEQRHGHEERIEKHRATVARCEQEGLTNFVTTNDAAALMKFPNGASMPGHRVTVTAAGTSVRLVINVLIDASGNDFGKLPVAVGKARAALHAAGVPVGQLLRFTADGGYTSEEDLLFALNAPNGVEVLVEDGPLRGHRSEEGAKFFTRKDFDIASDGTARCPAGRQMTGPTSDGPDRIRYNGVGCGTCPLRQRCTDRKTRSLTVRPKLEAARERIVDLMSQPGAREKYRKRIATVEPVFSGIEDAMGFRRVSTRQAAAARAEILLKVLAYNLSRLMAAKKLRYAWSFIARDEDGSLLLGLA